MPYPNVTKIKMKNWINLHNHTTFSMLDGHGTVEEYSKRVKELQMNALAITDHGNIHGWLDFYDECKERGVKPIFGLEAYMARKTRWDRDEEERAGRVSEEMDFDQRGPLHLTVLAKNYEGYQNLIKLSSDAWLEGYYAKPRLDYELIEKYSDGLIVLSGCLNGAVQQALLRDDVEGAIEHAAKMQDIVGKENYFIEVMNHGIDLEEQVTPALIEIAKTIGARIVPTGDCHYVRKEHAHYHDAMICAGTGARIADDDRFKFAGPEFYIKSYDEMAQQFEPEWLDNTCHLADMVNVELEFGDFHFPSYPDVPEDETVDEHLERLVWEGAKDRYGDPLPQEVVDRIEYEMGVVQRMGFQEYFLVVGDLVRWAKNQGIRVGWGRGSAAGCILSYCLKITNLDPIRFGLIFERFLIEGRKSMPDIDLDFDDRRRAEVIEYARQKYGEDRVAHICTFGTVGARMAIRDATRVLSYDYKTGDRIAKMVPPATLGVSKTLKESLEISADLRKAYENDPEAREILDTALGLEGVHRQPGIHAAGVLIAPGPMTDYVPVMRGGRKKDTITSAWDMDRCEQMGLLKVDFLGLRNLGIIDMTIENIKRYRGEDLDIDTISLNDQEVYDDLRKGNAIGVFQLESSGMREMMVALQPTSFEDIMALVSLYRPGPMGSGMDKMYINRKHGREVISYPHELLRDVLEPSYGIMLYQEDVLNVARTLAGFSAADADDLRRVIGKKKLKEVGEYREKFIEGARSTHQVPPQVSNKIYSDIEYFAGYGFNRAHAASYAMVAYVNAWLKHYYPASYMAALLTSVATKKDKLALYLNEARRMGINVLAPSVQSSASDFTILGDDQGILFGLSAIDGMGKAKVKALLRERNKHGEYKNLLDFMRKCDHDVLNKATLEHLSVSGALDDLVDTDIEKLDRNTKLELLEAEKQEIGIYVTDHPLSEVWEHVRNDVDTEILDLERCSPNSDVKILAIITDTKKLMTKAGKLMYRLNVQDLTGDIEVIIFPNDASRIMESHLEPGSIGILEARVLHEGDEDNFSTKLVYKKFSKLDLDEMLGDPPIYLESPEKLGAKQLARICDIINTVGGDSRVYLAFPEGEHKVTLQFTKPTSYTMAKKLQDVVKMAAIQNAEL